MFDVLPHLSHGDLPWLREAWEQAAADDRDTSMGGAPPLTWCDYVADVMRSDAEPMALAVRSGERLIGIVPFVRETRGRRIRLAAGGNPFRPQDVFGRHPGTALSTALRWLSSDRDRWCVNGINPTGDTAHGSLSGSVFVVQRSIWEFSIV